MVPFIAAGLWIGLQIDVPDCINEAVNRLTRPDRRPARTDRAADRPEAPERLYPVLVGGKVGYINRAGMMVVPAKYLPVGPIGIDAVSCPSPVESVYWPNRPIKWGRDFREGRAAVRTDRGWQLIDSCGRMLLDKPIAGAIYLWMKKPGEELLAVQLGGKWGGIDFTGREIIPFQFDGCLGVSQGLACVQQGNKMFWIDKTGRPVAWPSPVLSGPPPVFEDDLSLTSKGNLFGLTDRQGLWFVPPVYKDIGTFDGASIARMGRWVPSKPAATQPTTPIELASMLWGKMATAMKGAPHWDPPDPKGPPRLAVVITPDNAFGILDFHGRLRSEGLDGIYLREYGLRFSEGLARVSRNKQVGFVDRTGRIVIEPQFDYAEDFSGGLSRFTVGVSRLQLFGDLADANTARWGYVDRTGRIVWKPTR